MILRRIIIKNFRQFRDVNIDFAHNEEKNINMILGGNGTGKTNFLNAISWCLYGVEIHDFEDSSLDICNKKTENLAIIGDLVTVKVELEFFDEDEILIFSRCNGFLKGHNGLRSSPSSNKFEIKTKEGNEIRTNNSPFYTIERKLPKEIQNYFLFDETRLNRYFDSTQLKSLQHAIFNLSQIDLIEKVNSNIQKVKTNYINQQKKLSPKLGRTNERIYELENRIRISSERLDQAEIEIEEIRDELEKIEEKIISRNSTDIKSILKRKKDLDKRMAQLNKQIYELDNKLENHILLKYPYVMSYNSILQFVDLIDSSFNRRYISNDVKFFIENLLKDGKCICGTDLSVDIEHRKMLEDFLENTEDAPDYAENIPKTFEHIKNVIIKDIKNFKSTTIEYHREITSLKKELDVCIEERREIEAFLMMNPIEEIEDLTERRNTLIELERKAEIRILNLKESKKRNQHLLGEQRKLLSRQDELYMEFEKYQKKIDLCDGVTVSTKYLYNELKEDLRNKIQDITKKFLINAHWKEGEFVDLIIGEDFELNIKNIHGNIESPSGLSDGEKTVLAICFICALHKLTSFELPIVMDVSFTNLDSESRNNLINSLPTIIRCNQLILLSNENYYKNIYNNVIKEYNISRAYSAEGIESEVILNG